MPGREADPVFLAFLLLSVVAVSLVVALLTRGSAVLMGRLGGERIQIMHRSAEYIVDNHAVPLAWRQRRWKGPEGVTDPPAAGAATEMGRAEVRMRRACLGRLDGLIRHFERTSLFEDEETRHVLTNELEQVREEWAASSWREMCLPRAPAPRAPVDEWDPS
jgi:hypothetical protein